MSRDVATLVERLELALLEWLPEGPRPDDWQTSDWSSLLPDTQ